MLHALLLTFAQFLLAAGLANTLESFSSRVKIRSQLLLEGYTLISISSALVPAAPFRHSRFLILVAIASILLVSSSSIHADIFHLTDGKTIEGTIVREIGDLVSIRDQSGTIVTIDRSLIAKIETRATPLDEYLERVKKITAKDLEGHRALAIWCQQNQLNAQSQKHWKLVISLDPDHDEAREQLGYVWIGGDWYIKGSPEATQRREELVSDPDVPVREIPEELRLPDWERKEAPKLPDLPPLGKNKGDVVIVVADEKVGRNKPERSGLIYHLRRMGGDIQFVPGKEKDADIVVKVRTRCYFVRLQSFYGAPIANIFQGEAKAQFFQRNSAGKMVLRKTTTVRIPFSSSAQRPKEQALQYTYYVTLEAIAARVSRWSWMKERGSRSLTMPDTK